MTSAFRFIAETRGHLRYECPKDYIDNFQVYIEEGDHVIIDVSDRLKERRERISFDLDEPGFLLFRPMGKPTADWRKDVEAGMHVIVRRGGTIEYIICKTCKWGHNPACREKRKVMTEDDDCQSYREVSRLKEPEYHDLLADWQQWEDVIEEMRSDREGDDD